MVGLNDLNGLFQPKQFYGSVLSSLSVPFAVVFVYILHGFEKTTALTHHVCTTTLILF